MKKTLTALFTAIVLTAGTVQAATIGLAEWGINIDGTFANITSGDPLPGGVYDGGLDAITGLGTVTVSVTGVGSHNVLAFFDHEIDESTNTFFNETGSVHGSAKPGQSWQIDDPWNGTIYGNTSSSDQLSMLLDNINHGGDPNDVSMAMGWTFALLADQTAYLTFNITDLAAPTGFYLEQYDPDSQASIFFTSSLDTRGAEPVPEPSTVILLGAGLVGLGFYTRKKRQV